MISNKKNIVKYLLKLKGEISVLKYILRMDNRRYKFDSYAVAELSSLSDIEQMVDYQLVNVNNYVNLNSIRKLGSAIRTFNCTNYDLPVFKNDMVSLMALSDKITTSPTENFLSVLGVINDRNVCSNIKIYKDDFYIYAIDDIYGHVLTTDSKHSCEVFVNREIISRMKREAENG